MPLGVGDTRVYLSAPSTMQRLSDETLQTDIYART